MISNYLYEIKNRTLLLLITWTTTFITCYFYKEIIVFIFIYPSLDLFKKTCVYFISTNLIEIFYTNLIICNFISINILFFYLFYHSLMFLAPGLYKNEIENILMILFINFFLNVMFITFLYYIILPKSWEFFLSFQKTLNNDIKIYFEAQFYYYINFCIRLFKLTLFNCYVITLLLFLLLFFKKKSINIIKITRKAIYFLILVFSSIITPPDVFSQLLMSTFTIFVFETIILLILIKTNMKFN